MSFDFGGVHQKARNVVSFATSGLNKFEGIEISGMLGASMLNKMIVSIDYRDGLVKFDYDPTRIYEYPDFK